MSMDAAAAVQLLRFFCMVQARLADGFPEIIWTPAAWCILLSHGIDLYREICAALGTDTTVDEYLTTVRSSGSKLDQSVLATLFSELRSIPFNVQVLSHCSFLHFGSTKQLITSGLDLFIRDSGLAPHNKTLLIATYADDDSEIDAHDSWIEGCRIRSKLCLRNRNVLVGVDVFEPLELPTGACLDLSPGVDREGREAWFVRYYNVDDTFKRPVDQGATFCGKSLEVWLRSVGAVNGNCWNSDTP